MDLNEAIRNITAEKKYYAGKMPQSTASRIVIAIQKGTAKQKTIDWFMAKFGYSKISETWEKI